MLPTGPLLTRSTSRRILNCVSPRFSFWREVSRPGSRAIARVPQLRRSHYKVKYRLVCPPRTSAKVLGLQLAVDSQLRAAFGSRGRPNPFQPSVLLVVSDPPLKGGSDRVLASVWP